MSFPILSKEELVKQLRARGVHSDFFDLHAIDAVSTCHYHTIKDDVVRDNYSFGHFIEALALMEHEAKRIPINIHDVRTRASYLCATSINKLEPAGGWLEGLMD